MSSILITCSIFFGSPPPDPSALYISSCQVWALNIERSVMQADHNVPGCSPGIFFAIFSDLAARMAGKPYFAAASFLSVFLKPAKANIRLPDAHAVAWL
ncbi:hypothetical protein [uncultured Allobaculum sp.]|uniref:hypothetical protein n=1 Tax=uncultured Allobaculum sp. TaxID=1187017 RepID=UPI00261B5605|nr:hypothetical protein [uncultured Allobaculum sp.]